MANKLLFHATWKCTVCILQTLRLQLSQISPASGIEMKPAKLTLTPSGWGFTDVQNRQHLITALKKRLATPLACQICFLGWGAAVSCTILCCLHLLVINKQVKMSLPLRICPSCFIQVGAGWWSSEAIYPAKLFINRFHLWLSNFIRFGLFLKCMAEDYGSGSRAGIRTSRRWWFVEALASITTVPDPRLLGMTGWRVSQAADQVQLSHVCACAFTCAHRYKTK